MRFIVISSLIVVTSSHGTHVKQCNTPYVKQCNTSSDHLQRSFNISIAASMATSTNPNPTYASYAWGGIGHAPCLGLVPNPTYASYAHTSLPCMPYGPDMPHRHINGYLNEPEHLTNPNPEPKQEMEHQRHMEMEHQCHMEMERDAMIQAEQNAQEEAFMHAQQEAPS